MYKKLDNMYKNKSFVILYRAFVLLVIIVSVLIFYNLNDKYSFLSDGKIAFYLIMLTGFIILLFLHFVQYAILFFKKRITKKNWWIIFSPFDCLDEFLDLEYELDIGLIFNFLIENGIDNKEKVKIAIVYLLMYQTQPKISMI